MVITNKRLKLPDELTIDGHVVKIVDKFKLLGVTIDNKLTFNKYISDLKKAINQKLFSIKRLFYLSTSVKIQFYKTFVMPYFNYCLSLIIYYPRTAIQNLSNCFNMCIHKLFKFEPTTINGFEVTPSAAMEFSNKLQDYGLQTFQNLLLSKFAKFNYNLIHNQNAPTELKSILIESVTSVNDNDKGETNSNNTCDLRNGKKVIKELEYKSKFIRRTFEDSMVKFITKIGLNLKDKSISILNQININQNLYLSKFLSIFPIFDAKYYKINFKKNYFKKNSRVRNQIQIK